jgi:hypothetical protein
MILAVLGVLTALPASATAAQDIGTTIMSSIRVVAEVSCPARSLRIIDPQSFVPCGADRQGRAIDAGTADEAPISRLLITFVDMNGGTRTAIVSAPNSGAQQAPVEYRSGSAAPIAPSRKRPCTWSFAAETAVMPGLRCDAEDVDGTRRTWLVQKVTKKAEDFGGSPGEMGMTIYVSTWTSPADAPGRPTWAHAGAPPTVTTFDLPPLGTQTFDGLPKLTAYTRWSKFSPGGYSGYLKGQHFETIFGSFTYSGYGVYGPGNRFGAPTTSFGRNVYIDTLDSDYGPGWHRIMGVLTQPPNGTFCYEVAKKGGSNGKTGAGRSYRLTAIGPGLTPVVQVTLKPPAFTFGAPGYDPKTMPWGTGFSDGQTQALRDQAAQMGSDFRRKVKGTDCAQTLRQLPDSFFTPAFTVAP